jgi:hypothetical protein
MIQHHKEINESFLMVAATGDKDDVASQIQTPTSYLSTRQKPPA